MIVRCIQIVINVILSKSSESYWRLYELTYLNEQLYMYIVYHLSILYINIYIHLCDICSLQVNKEWVWDEVQVLWGIQSLYFEISLLSSTCIVVHAVLCLIDMKIIKPILILKLIIIIWKLYNIICSKYLQDYNILFLITKLMARLFNIWAY